MNQLKPYIYNLLKDNDCVIIPGLGAFIAREIPAQYDSAEGIYKAPAKELSFNSVLKEEDGLLASNVAAEKNISYVEAKGWIADQVSASIDLLRSENAILLQGIGQLKVNAEGKTEFISEKKRFDHINWYGVQNEIKIKELKPESTKLALVEEKDIPMKNNVIRWSASGVAAAIITGVILVFPTGKLDNAQQASIVTQPTNEITIPAPIQDNKDTAADFLVEATIESNDAPAEESEATIDMEDVIAEKEVVADKQQGNEDVEKYFHIVIGSVPTSASANLLAKQFKNKGISASVLDCGNRYRVVNKTFTKKETAVNYLSKFKKEYPKLKDAWVFVEKIK